MTERKDETRSLGTTWGIDYTITGSDGLPLDLSIAGTSLLWRLVKVGPPRAKAMDRTIGSGLVIDPDQVLNRGLVRLDVTPLHQTTASIAPGEYEYELTVTMPNGAVDPQAFGRFYVARSLKAEFA